MSGVSAVRLHGMTEASCRWHSSSCTLRNPPLDTSSQPGPKIFSLGPKLKKNWSGGSCQRQNMRVETEPWWESTLKREEQLKGDRRGGQVADRKYSYLRGQRGRTLSKVIIIDVKPGQRYIQLWLQSWWWCWCWW